MPRPVIVIVLVCLLLAALYFLFETETGRSVRSDPSGVRAWVHAHQVIAPLAFLAVYVVATVLCLPVWWLQVLAGFGFGIFGGVLFSLTGSTLGAIAACLVSTWLVGDWFHQRIEGRMRKLRALDQKLDQNGLLVVIIVRLIHGMPFGLSNYAFGLIGVPLAEVAAGTFLGSVPAVSLIVTLGVAPRSVITWQFITVQVLMHVALLVPIGWYYWRRRTRATAPGAERGESSESSHPDYTAATTRSD